MASHGLPMYMTGYPTTSYNQIRKKRELKLNPYLEAVGIARIMEISSKPTLSREQKPYLYHYTIIMKNFLRSQILSITSYCRLLLTH